MEADARTSTSAKLYFVIFIVACAHAAPTSENQDGSESTGSGIGHGSSSLLAQISAAGPEGQGSNINLNGGSWNSANGYLSQGAGYNNAGGSTNGGSNGWATGAGQSVTGGINAQSQSGGSYNLELASVSGDKQHDSSLPDRGIVEQIVSKPGVTVPVIAIPPSLANFLNNGIFVAPPAGLNVVATLPNNIFNLDVAINGNKRDEQSLGSSGSVEANAGAVMTGSATSGVGSQSSLSLNGGVSSGGSTWFNSPPPSESQNGYASSNGFVGGSGDNVVGTLDTHDTVNPVIVQVSSDSDQSVGKK